MLQERRDYLDNANALREKHRDLKEAYNNLKQRMVVARQRRQFVEPKVQNLWKTAQESNFTEKELAALKEELFHFESRLLKLSHLHAEHAVSNEKQKVSPQNGSLSFRIFYYCICILTGEETHRLQREGQGH